MASASQRIGVYAEHRARQDLESLAFDLRRARALSSEVDSGSREENAAEQEDRASLGF